jgi:hypothetical protein
MDALYLNFRIVDTPSARFQALTQAALRPSYPRSRQSPSTVWLRKSDLAD